jgi:hypothetical protein
MVDIDNSNKIFFCKKTGCLIKTSGSKLIKPFKPKDFRSIRHTEIDWKESFSIMKEFISKNYDNDEVTIKKSSFVVLRKKYITFLKELTKKYKFCDQTFYTTLEFADKILRNLDSIQSITYSKLELIVIGCFLLAGKISLLQ